MRDYTAICQPNKKNNNAFLLLSSQSVYLISAKRSSSHPLLSHSRGAKWQVRVKDCPKGDTFWTSPLNDAPARALSSSARPSLKVVKRPAEARAENYNTWARAVVKAVLLLDLNTDDVQSLVWCLRRSVPASEVLFVHYIQGQTSPD